MLQKNLCTKNAGRARSRECSGQEKWAWAGIEPVTPGTRPAATTTEPERKKICAQKIIKSRKHTVPIMANRASMFSENHMECRGTRTAQRRDQDHRTPIPRGSRRPGVPVVGATYGTPARQKPSAPAPQDWPDSRATKIEEDILLK